jgi:hypothetical protein
VAKKPYCRILKEGLVEQNGAIEGEKRGMSECDEEGDRGIEGRASDGVEG